jgi:outer membrane protein TolC
MDVATVERLMVGLRADMGEARDAGSWAALSSMHRMERAYEIDLHASRKAEAAEAEARRAAALAGTDSAALFESIVAAIRSLPDVDRERLLAEVVGPAPLRVVV